MVSDIKSSSKASQELYTKQLFFEMADPPRDNVLYTLKDEDHQGFPSIKRLYVDLEDQSEYLFATTYFASWYHFKRLAEISWFKPVLEEMREEPCRQAHGQESSSHQGQGRDW